MPWRPTTQVLDPRKIKNNILSFIADNQSDALKWAAETLVPIFYLHKTPTNVTAFPACSAIQVSHNTKWVNDILIIDFSIVFEAAVIHGDRNILADRALQYSMALESMLMNVPETTFQNHSTIDITSTAMGVETQFDVQGKYKNQFIEVFQTKPTWIIEASAY